MQVEHHHLRAHRLRHSQRLLDRIDALLVALALAVVLGGTVLS